MSSLTKDSLMGYLDIDFGGTGNLNKFTVNIASIPPHCNSEIEIRIDPGKYFSWYHGQLIGTLTITNTGGELNWQEQSCYIPPITGVHDVMLVFKGDNGGGNIDWLTFGNYDPYNLDLVNMNITQDTQYACPGYIRAESFSVPIKP